VNRAETAQEWIGRAWAVIRESFVLVSSPSWGIAPSFATIAPGHRTGASASPAWPGRHPGRQGLVTGLRGRSASANLAADSDGSALVGLSGGLFLCLRPSLPSAQGPLCLISGFMPGA